MADIFDSDSDSDSDASFHRFSREEIEEAFRRNNARVDPDESLDLSVEENSSSEDESETESSSEDSDNDQAVRPDVDESWSTELNRICAPQFEGIPGPKHVLGANKKEVDFFNIVFSPELYRKIALETNLYA